MLQEDCDTRRVFRRGVRSLSGAGYIFRGWWVIIGLIKRGKGGDGDIGFWKEFGLSRGDRVDKLRRVWGEGAE